MAEMSEHFLAWLKTLIADNNLHLFYISREWRRLSEKILKEQKECQICKQNRKWGPAQIAHHRFTVREHPELALSRFTPDGEPNIIAVCIKCHNKIHFQKRRYTNPERW